MNPESKRPALGMKSGDALIALVAAVVMVLAMLYTSDLTGPNGQPLGVFEFALFWFRELVALALVATVVIVITTLAVRRWLQGKP